MDDFVAMVRSLSFVWSRFIAIAALANMLSVSFLTWIPLVIGYVHDSPQSQVSSLGGAGGGVCVGALAVEVVCILGQRAASLAPAVTNACVASAAGDGSADVDGCHVRGLCHGAHHVHAVSDRLPGSHSRMQERPPGCAQVCVPD